MPFATKTIPPNNEENHFLPSKIITPQQTHSNNIIEIKTGDENLENCDGIFTATKNDFVLGAKTADCAAISFYDKNCYGIIHAGWRGSVNGIIEKMKTKFKNPKIHVSPILKRFEIQKDFCYKEISSKFGKKFFTEDDNSIIFEFEEALKFLLGESATFDPRDTFKDENLASWRRDKASERNLTIIYKND